MKKIISLILSLVLFAGALVSCGELGSYSINSKKVMTVGGVSVSYDMYKFCYNMALAEMGEDFDASKEENRIKVQKSAEESVRLYCAQIIMFDKYGVELTSDDKKEVDAEIQSYIDEQEGEDNYEKWLSENYTSGKFFREQIERMYYLDPYLRDILFTGIDEIIKMDDATVRKDVEDNFYRYTQIFISVDANDNYLSKRMEIDSAYDALEAGSSFSSVALQYSDWNVSTEKGVYTAKGEKLIEIEEAALKLDAAFDVNEGEYSEIIETSEGFHIIKRLVLDNTYITEHLDDLGYISATRRYNEYLRKLADELDVKYTEYFQTISHDDWVKIEYK